MTDSPINVPSLTLTCLAHLDLGDLVAEVLHLLRALEGLALQRLRGTLRLDGGLQLDAQIGRLHSQRVQVAGLKLS